VAAILVVLGLTSPGNTGEGPERYGGTLRGDVLEMTIDLGASSAEASIHYELTNPADKALDVAASFRGGLAKAEVAVPRKSIAPGQRLRLVHSPTFAVEGSGLKTVRIEPGLDIEGRMFVSRFRSIEVKVLLPPGVHSVMYSSLGPAQTTTDPSSGRQLLRYTLTDRYFVPLLLKWHADVRIDVTKTASRSGQNVDVTVGIVNSGSRPLSDIRVSDDFAPEILTKWTPASEFKLAAGGANDRRLVWTRRVESLGPGERQSLTYRIVLQPKGSAPLTLGRTTVTRASGELLGASERLTVALN
jgi:hypothetical protein